MDIVDVRERMEDLEADVAKLNGGGSGGGSGNRGGGGGSGKGPSKGELDGIKKDLDFVMGRGRSPERDAISGIPSLVSAN